MIQSPKKMGDVQVVHIAVHARTVADAHTVLMVAAVEYVLHILHLLDIRHREQLVEEELKILLKIL